MFYYRPKSGHNRGRKGRITIPVPRRFRDDVDAFVERWLAEHEDEPCM